MLASATEIVYALGLEDRLVAISHECDYPPEALVLPRASRSHFDPAGLTSAEIDGAVRDSMASHGAVYEVDAALLARLEPELILTQAVCEVCAVPTGSVLEAVEGMPRPARVESLDAHTLDEILDSVQAVAEAAGVPARGEAVVAGLRARLQRVADGVAGREQPRVLMLEWLDPPFATGHWVPEMVLAAGGDELMGRVGARSREVDWAEIAGLDPDVLLVEPCGYDLDGARRDADLHAERLLRIAGRAVREGRAWLLHSAYFSRSGPRVVEGVEALAALLHRGEETPGISRRWSPP